MPPPRLVREPGNWDDSGARLRFVLLEDAALHQRRVALRGKLHGGSLPPPAVRQRCAPVLRSVRALCRTQRACAHARERTSRAASSRPGTVATESVGLVPARCVRGALARSGTAQSARRAVATDHGDSNLPCARACVPAHSRRRADTSAMRQWPVALVGLVLWQRHWCQQWHWPLSGSCNALVFWHHWQFQLSMANYNRSMRSSGSTLASTSSPLPLVPALAASSTPRGATGACVAARQRLREGWLCSEPAPC